MTGKKMATPAAGMKTTGDNDGLLAALCYIIALLVPLYILFTEKKTNRFLAFHAWQSLATGIALFFVFVVLSVVLGALTFIPVIGSVSGLGLTCGLPLLALAVVIYWFFIAYKAYQGEKFKIPMIGDFAEKQVK